MGEFRFTLAAGKGAGIQAHAGHVAGQDAVLVVGGTLVPDTVRLPAQLGGRWVRRQSSRAMLCPVCQGAQEHTAHVLAMPEGVAPVAVMECPVGGFLWVTY